MKTNKKPDLLIVLTICVGLGVAVSMYSQRALYDQIAPKALSQSSITTINQATQHESHALDSNILVKVNDTLQRKQQEQDSKHSVGRWQPRVYQF